MVFFLLLLTPKWEYFVSFHAQGKLDERITIANCKLPGHMLQSFGKWTVIAGKYRSLEVILILAL